MELVTFRRRDVVADPSPEAHRFLNALIGPVTEDEVASIEDEPLYRKEPPRVYIRSPHPPG